MQRLCSAPAFPPWLSKTSEVVSQSVFPLELFTSGSVTVMQSCLPQYRCSFLIVSFQPEKSFYQSSAWLCLKGCTTVSRNSTGSRDVAKQSQLQWLIRPYHLNLPNPLLTEKHQCYSAESKSGLPELDGMCLIITIHVLSDYCK